MIHLHLESRVPTVIEPTERACRVAAMFGLGVDEQHSVAVVPPIDLTLRPGQIVFITGASGGGKSSLLRLVRETLREHEGVRIVEFAEKVSGAAAAAAPDTLSPALSLLDLLELPLDAALRTLSLAGLSDAFTMLRSPGQLSEGQRFRWNLARAMAEVECGMRSAECGTGEPERARPASQHSALRTPHSAFPFPILLADEFASTLDRLTATAVARSVRKWVTRAGVCLLAASAHDDLLEHLEPDTLVEMRLGGQAQVMERGSAPRFRSANPGPSPSDTGAGVSRISRQILVV